MLRELEARTIEYPASDGEPMAETGFHITVIVYILSMLRVYFRNRADVYVSGDMFMYYEEGDPLKHVAPDAFVAFGVAAHERRSWFVWQEGKAPDVVFEITSRSTRAEDLGSKKGLYQWLGVQEYFLFDPLDEYLSPRLQGFRLASGVYQPITFATSELSSSLLGLTLYAEGDKLRLRDARTGEPLPLPTEEAEARAAAQARAAAAEEEVARLRAELTRLRGQDQ